jgi:transmembrane sensor
MKIEFTMEENYKLAKWLNDEMTKEELVEFQSTPEFATYQKIKDFSNTLKVSEFDDSAILTKVLASKKEKPKVISLSRKQYFMRIAAVLVVGLGLTFITLTQIPNKQLAENGKRTQFLLPDQSEVVLNSGSKIEYKKWNWNNNRNLNLEGEAYFHVAKGKKFEVKTKLGNVIVVGTQFNVKTRKNRFEVTCFEGKVKVNYKNTQLLLTAGQSVFFENDKQVNDITNNLEPEWMSNTIAFKNEKIQNIFDEIERQYNVTITLKSEKPTALFTGKLPLNNLNTAIQIISTTYDLKLTQFGEKNIIFERK